MQSKNDRRTTEIYETLKLNYEITRLYALYLEHCPEIITKEMMDELCSDGELDKKSALVALLCQIFGLDIDNGKHDRRLIREYLTPSVRLLNAEKYRQNPYYKNIKIPSVKDGSWELKSESYAPFRGFICHDMQLYDDFREIPPIGFFEEVFDFPAVLENGNEWMTLTPVDLDTCDEAIERAKGKVVTFGLGLGYYAYMVSQKPEVEGITVVEKSSDVIALFEKHILPQFPNRSKVRIINEDAFAYAATMGSEGYDYAFVDTWRDASDGALMYKRMKALEKHSPHTKFDYWIDGFIISRLRAEVAEALWQRNFAPDFDEVRKMLENPIECKL